MVGIEGLLIQGELLRTQGVVEFNHLRKLQEEINRIAGCHSTSGGQQSLDTVDAFRSYTCVPQTFITKEVNIWDSGGMGSFD